jgi:hypothetical protein
MLLDIQTVFSIDTTWGTNENTAVAIPSKKGTTADTVRPRREGVHDLSPRPAQKQIPINCLRTESREATSRARRALPGICPR